MGGLVSSNVGWFTMTSMSDPALIKSNPDLQGAQAQQLAGRYGATVSLLHGN